MQAEIKGHYLILVYAEYANLKSPSGTAQRQALEQFATNIITGSANINLSTRMLTGKRSSRGPDPRGAKTRRVTSTPFVMNVLREADGTDVAVGTARQEPGRASDNDMNATLMSPEQHQSGIHVVGGRAVGRGSGTRRTGCLAEAGAGLSEGADGSGGAGRAASSTGGG